MREEALKPSKRVRTQSVVKGSAGSPPGSTTPQPSFTRTRTLTRPRSERRMDNPSS